MKIKGEDLMGEMVIKELISLHKHTRSNALFVLVQMMCLFALTISNWSYLIALHKMVAWAFMCVAVMTALPNIIIFIGETRMIKFLKKELKGNESNN